MFTGLITDLGKVRAAHAATAERDARLEFDTGYETAGIDIGASIACSGCCLTVVETGAGWFAVEASGETLERTTLGAWGAGTAVNFERPLRIGDELGGHIVSGHVDGTARVVSRTPEGGSTRFVFEAPGELARYLAPKGSVALDGVSLTVNEVEDARFGVNIIPHTLECTAFGGLAADDMVNIEVDMLARYVARQLGSG